MRILALGRLRPTIVSLHCHLRWRQGCLPALLRSTAYSLLSLLSESQWPWLAYPWKQSCVVDLTLWAQSAMACCACGPLITLAHFLRISTLGASEAFVFLKQGPTIQPRLGSNSPILLHLPPQCWDYGHVLLTFLLGREPEWLREGSPVRP